MAAEPRRVFVDTNVLASILWKPGSATHAVALLAAGRAPTLVSETVLDELARFVHREGARRPAIVGQHRVWLQKQAPWSDVLPDPDRNAIERLLGRVPTEDAPVVAAALAGGATYLLSGDRGLLAALPSVGLRALAPSDVRRLHASGDWPWETVP